MSKVELHSMVFAAVKRRIDDAARKGYWAVEIRQLNRKHAYLLVEDGLTVEPHPDEHDYEEFSDFTVSWH